MTIRYTMEIAESISALLAPMAKNTAQALVGIVETEYVKLLHNAPQKYGNYVANCAIAAGGRAGAGRKTAKLLTPISTTPKDRDDASIVARGSLTAIDAAREQNAHIKATLTNHITMLSGGFPPEVTVYNRIAYAEDVDKYSATKVEGQPVLRVPNRPGAHAMTKFAASLAFAMRANIAYGSPEFYRLAKSKII